MTPEDSTVWVERWWAALVAIACVNVVAWALVARHARRRLRADAETWWERRPHVWLSGAFVLGCAFRSVVPRADVQRICLHDMWLSNVAVGRSVATIAELCFMAQLSLYLRETGRATGDRLAVGLSRAILPVIAVAETCSWYAVLTTNYLGNVLEESLWALAASLLLAGGFSLYPRARALVKATLGACMVFAAAYVAFMVRVDVPMYLARWRADTAAGRRYLSLGEGLQDLLTRWVPTWRWGDWHDEIPWMTLYFSLAVWMSIGLVVAPRQERRAGQPVNPGA